MANFSLDEYVDVAERIQQFYARYPEGSLVTNAPPSIMEAGGKTFVVYGARAYRTPDDPRPAEGWAWEPVPGTTPFTRDSELQNAETAAWGRAIVALGFVTKHIASQQEVRNRRGQDQEERSTARKAPQGSRSEAEPPKPGAPAWWGGFVKACSSAGISGADVALFLKADHPLTWQPVDLWATRNAVDPLELVTTVEKWRVTDAVADGAQQ